MMALRIDYGGARCLLLKNSGSLPALALRIVICTRTRKHN